MSSTNLDVWLLNLIELGLRNFELELAELEKSLLHGLQLSSFVARG